MRRKLIIDTDTGVDDAMALLMALEAHKRGQVEVLAITAVAGNTEESHAQRNILRTIDSIGCPDIPVYRGAEEAMVVTYNNDEHYHGVDGFNDVTFDTCPDTSRINEERAWSVFSRLTRAHPGEVTLVALGPLTNLAIGLLADPGLGARLASLFIMGGNMEAIGNVTPTAEFNFHADPEAAHTVLRLTQCPTTLATWELSYKYNFIPLSWRREVLGKIDTPQAKMINSLEKVWFEGDWPWGENWILCDQLAMLACLYPESVKRSSSLSASVELGGVLTRGMMVVDRRPGAETRDQRRVTLLEELDTDILKESLTRAFSAQ